MCWEHLTLETVNTLRRARCVALAMELGVPLVTTDKQILRDFPGVPRALGDYR